MTSIDVSRSVPGGWYGSDLAARPESWRVALPDDVRDDLLRAAADIAQSGIGGNPHQPRPHVSEHTRDLVAELYRRLSGEPGMVVLTGFPVQQDPELTERAYLVLAALLGQPVLQTLDGRLVTRVEVLDPSVKVPGAQKIGIPSALPFHVDRATDLIGLLCIRQAQTGGLSLLVSARTLHNVMAERHPDLISVMYEPVPVHVPPFKIPDGDTVAKWCQIPVFSQVNGQFAAHYDRAITERTLKQFPDAPRLTERQVAAFDAADEIIDMPEVQLRMALQPGDLQLINNFSVMHSRTAYRSETSEQGRLLLRLHFAFGGSPELPAEFTELYGATGAGTYRGGMWRTPEVQGWLGTPLQAA